MMHMRNSSDERLLAGPSALAWFRAALVSMIGLAIGTPGFVVFAIVERAARGTASDVTWLLAFHLSIGLLYAALLGAVLFGSLFSAKTRRELIRGYTTMPREKKAVDVVDPRTGDVLRPAMAPALATRADVRRARADIRVPWRSRERPDPERQEPVKVRTIA
ncbi:MAG: hypothetical protein JWP75_1538, partial [Frondihabitans sp.]|nr:hypothetical protein [Frondihabitans sp.]